MKSYILNENGVPVPEPDMVKWGRWMWEASRVVAREEVREAVVSTVFLGLDHSFAFDYPDAPPVLWETMVFGGLMDQAQDRCSGTREQAEAMHADMVARVQTNMEVANK